MTLEPTGPHCGAKAVEVITWIDGRTSAACRDHGAEALTEEALLLVADVERVQPGRSVMERRST
jgi:hypothetical protein